MTIPKLILYSLIALLSVIATKAAVDEMAMCRIEIDDGSAGLVIAVPRFDYCFYMLDRNDPGNQPGDTPALSFIGSQQMDSEQGDEPRKVADLRRVAPCLSRFAKNRGGSWWIKPELEKSCSGKECPDKTDKEII